MPILEVIRGSKLHNVIVVVTRYFGGTLLGTGGLVRAYGGCAKLGIESSNVEENVLYHLIDVKVDYTLSGKVQYEILQNDYIINDTGYLDQVCYSVLVEYNKKESFLNKMIDITSGAADIINKGIYYGTGTNDEIRLRKVDQPE